MVEKKASKDSIKVIDVKSEPSAAEKADVASGENYSKEKKKSGKGINTKFLIIGAVVLVLIIALALFFSMPKYKYSYNINGVSYLSNDYVPSEFFKEMKSNNDIYVSIDTGTQTRDQMVVDSELTWLVVLKASNKNAIMLNRAIDENNNVAFCVTNDGNISVSKRIDASSCAALLKDDSKMKILISIGEENAAYLSKNSLKIFATGRDTISVVNQLVVLQAYPDANALLNSVNDIIGSIK